MNRNKGNKKQKGQGLVEYALILVLVAVVVVAALSLLGPQINGVFSRINAALISGGGGGSGGAGSGSNNDLIINFTCPTNQWYTVKDYSGTTMVPRAACTTPGSNFVWSFPNSAERTGKTWYIYNDSDVYIGEGTFPIFP